MSKYAWWKSKTVWGAIIVAAGTVITHPDPTTIAQAIGAVIAVVGARDAVAKNGIGQ